MAGAGAEGATAGSEVVRTDRGARGLGRGAATFGNVVCTAGTGAGGVAFDGAAEEGEAALADGAVVDATAAGATALGTTLGSAAAEPDGERADGDADASGAA